MPIYGKMFNYKNLLLLYIIVLIKKILFVEKENNSNKVMKCVTACGKSRVSSYKDRLNRVLFLYR